MAQLPSPGELKLALGRALLGNVSRTLRAVQHSISDAAVRVRFTYERSPSEAVKELQSVAHTECATDFVDDAVVEFETAVVPVGTKVPEWGDWFFLRSDDD
jgi:hypothetical protein